MVVFFWLNIKMKKKIEIDKQVVEAEVVEKPKIGKSEIEFNNEGLNSLQAKLNEVIEFLNK